MGLTRQIETMTEQQLAPDAQSAVSLLRQLLETAVWPQHDATTDDGASATLATWQVAEAAIQRIEIDLGLRQPKGR